MTKEILSYITKVRANTKWSRKNPTEIKRWFELRLRDSRGSRDKKSKEPLAQWK